MVSLNNLVVLGQGAPNQLKDKRQAKCVCAYSLDTKEFYRIYPIPIKWLRKWTVFDVEVEKVNTDHRENTWKVKNSREDWNVLEKWIKPKGVYPDEQKRALIESINLTTLGELRKNGKSFGLVKPNILKFELEQRNPSTTKQTTLSSIQDLDQGFCIINQYDYKFKPYVQYECIGDCSCKNKIHRQHMIEWGCYEYMRKNPGKEENLKDNLHLFDDNWIKYFLLGNIHKSPKTYIIIDVLRYKNKD